MFLHLLKYRLKTFLKPSPELFWNLAFPFILATFFYLAFGNAMSKSEDFQTINVSVVKEKEPDEYFAAFLDELSSDGDSKMLNITETDSDNATKLLSDDDIDGIITISDDISLTVAEEDFAQSILQSLLNQYKQTAAMISDIAASNPDGAMEALAALTDSVSVNEEISLSSHSNTDPMASYFYALIAMQCLFGSLFGLRATINSQANLSSLAARRCITPTHKLSVILSDFVGSVIIQYASIVLLILYLNFCLSINFGDQLPLVFLTAFVGCIVGVSMGIFVTSIGKGSEALKVSILSSVSLILCFFSGLMVYSMKDIVEKHFPLFNRINPAALISDAIFSLSIYDTYDRYLFNMGILLIISAIFCIASFFMTRRERYASI